jgi:hypothetical protein
LHYLRVFSISKPFLPLDLDVLELISSDIWVFELREESGSHVIRWDSDLPSDSGGGSHYRLFKFMLSRLKRSTGAGLLHERLNLVVHRFDPVGVTGKILRLHGFGIESGLTAFLASSLAMLTMDHNIELYLVIVLENLVNLGTVASHNGVLFV